MYSYSTFQTNVTKRWTEHEKAKKINNENGRPWFLDFSGWFITLEDWLASAGFRPAPSVRFNCSWDKRSLETVV